MITVTTYLSTRRTRSMIIVSLLRSQFEVNMEKTDQTETKRPLRAVIF